MYDFLESQAKYLPTIFFVYGTIPMEIELATLYNSGLIDFNNISIVIQYSVWFNIDFHKLALNFSNMPGKIKSNLFQNAKKAKSMNVARSQEISTRAQLRSKI